MDLAKSHYFQSIALGLFAVLILLVLVSIDSFFLQVLLVFGLSLGAVLNYFMFGFTSAWRNLILYQKTLGVRAQIWMLTLASLLFLPLILIGQHTESDYQGLVRPVSLSVVLGAFLFGIGMQLAGSCSSGTLNRLGKLAPFSFLTFPFLLVGGVLASYFYGSWVNWPSLNPTSFSMLFNGFGVLISLGLFGIIYGVLIGYERTKTGYLEPMVDWQAPSPFIKRLHPLFIAGILLALLNFLVFIWSGQPWSIASVFTIWGIKLAALSGFGFDWAFWDVAILYGERFERPLLQDPVSLTAIGLILGSLFVTLLGRSDSKHEPLRLKNVIYAMLGGLLMGFGATLSYGCNIGAFFSGIASGSLHGWLWIVFAVLGNILALKWIMRK